MDALAGADLIVLGPSNPYLSIGPILALPGLRAALAASPVPVVAVSPVLAGQALKGPTAELLRAFTGASDCTAVARLYVDFLDGLVIDPADAGALAALGELGVATHVTPIVVPTELERRRLAEAVLAFGARLAGRP
jgi:LPPG:FO 2-phospho-L-lactate transferase